MSISLWSRRNILDFPKKYICASEFSQFPLFFQSIEHSSDCIFSKQQIKCIGTTLLNGPVIIFIYHIMGCGVASQIILCLKTNRFIL